MSRHGASVLARLRAAPGGDLAPAVVTPGGDWSRRELLDRAEAGAAVLANEWGSSLIGVCLPEGADLATAVLAAMGAGGAAPVRADLPADAIAAHFTRTRVAAVVATVDSPAAMAARDLGLAVISPNPDDVFHLRRPDRPPSHHAQDDIADLALVLTTSGTTGEPKVVPLRHGNLVSSIERIAESLGLAPEDRSLAVMPLTHIHGMVAAFLAPLVAGGAVFLGGRFDPVTLPDAAASFGATFVTAVPTIHRALAASPPDNAAWTERLRLVRSSSSALPASVAELLERRFGVPVLEAYGMTEAAHQITSNTVEDLRRGTVGRADGVRVRVIDDEGRTREPDRVGDVVIRGRNVMGGYIADAAVNDAAFVDGWFRTGDLGRIDTAGHLVLVGRTKEMINRGGETIAPGPIEEVLRSLDGVHDAVAFAAPHPTLGEQVAAAVVTDRAGPVPVARLQREVARRLGDADVPRIVHTVDEIPVGPTGKVQRSLLPALLGAAPQHGAEEGFTDIEADVAAIWQTVGLRPVDRHDDFIALGGDSLMAISVAIELASRWQVDIRPADILWDSTVSGMAALHDRPFVGESITSRVAHAGPTPAQRRLLVADRLGLDRLAENMAFAWRVDGNLDPARIHRAVDAVVRRHPALRSTFAPPPASAVRPVTADHAYSWTSGVAVAEHEPTAAFGALAAEPYDLVDGPLLRFGVWPIEADGGWVFGFAYHHVLFDGRSRRIVLDDLERAFVDALPAGEVAPARAAWSPLTETDRQWWSARARGVPVELAWTTRAIGRDTDHRAVVERMVIDRTTLAALRRCAAVHQVTPTMVLVAATALGVARLTGETRIVVGLPIDHRMESADEAVGSTMDAVPVIVNVAASATPAQLLAAVRRECLEAFRRSEAGLQAIREAVGRTWGEALIHARAQVRTTTDTLSLGDRRVDPIRLDPPVARTPIALDLRIADLTATLEVTFDSSVVAADVTASYARSFGAILETLTEGSDGRLSDLEWVSEADRSSVERWGDGDVDEPPFATVSEWFDACVEQWPTHVAIRTSDRQITFRDLAAMVERAAAALVDRTDGGDVVALALPRGVEQIVVQLAVWRSGRLAVAVAPDAPVERTRAQLRATAPRVIVAAGDVSGATDGFDRLDVEVVLAGGSRRCAPSWPDPHAPAWACFTSGSTGDPVTVIGSQSNLVHLVHGWHRFVPPEAHGVASVSKPVSAVGLLSEWLVPLLAGNELFLFSAVVARDPFRIATRIAETGVTWYRGTPAMLDVVASTVLANDGPNRHVRFVVSGADTLPRATADLVQRAFPAATIVNQYGCTEATAESTLGVVANGDGHPDIGRPLANVTVEVVDDQGRRVPPGVSGEIVIRGPLVAGSVSDAGVHASGDFGWWDGEGRLHFSGRRDRRLSVKGNRIDAGDVEAALRTTGLVDSAVVMIDPDDTRSRDLAAVVILGNGHTLADVRGAAGQVLPLFAVPNRIRVVDALPMLPGGKVDLRAARALLIEPEPAGIAPLEPQVADIRAVVASVLRRPPSTIDPARSLQANGGDSFAAIALHEQLRAINGSFVDIAVLLDDRPLSELAIGPSSSLGDCLPGRLRRVAVGASDDRRVVWFPGGGGLDTEVRRLVHHLASPPEVLVYPYPGSEIGERPSLLFHRLARRIVASLMDLDGPPPILAGNSFGGIIAAEVACRLMQQRPGWVRGLLIVDALPVEHRRRARSDMMAAPFRSDLRAFLAERRRDDTAPAVRWRRNYRASRLMLAGHTRTGRVSGVPVVVVATAERRAVTGHHDLGWSAHLGNKVEVVVLSGDHGGLLVEPRVIETAPAIAEALDRLASPWP